MCKWNIDHSQCAEPCPPKCVSTCYLSEGICDSCHLGDYGDYCQYTCKVFIAIVLKILEIDIHVGMNSMVLHAMTSAQHIVPLTLANSMMDHVHLVRMDFMDQHVLRTAL